MCWNLFSVAASGLQNRIVSKGFTIAFVNPFVFEPGLIFIADEPIAGRIVRDAQDPAPMFTRDYILRQIQQLVAVLARVLLLRNSGQPKELLDEVRVGLADNELGAALHDAIPREDLIALCSTESGFSCEKALALADLLREKGYAEQELQMEDWSRSLLHALWLYEHIASLPNAIVPIDMADRISSLRTEIGGFSLN